MAISKKHHYLPEFYLKGFVTDKGTFSVFDHAKNAMKAKEHSPSSHFFGLHRNTVEFNNDVSDFPEQGYSQKDNLYAQVFNIIQSSQTVPVLDASQMLTLQEFVSNLFWRLPVNDLLYEEEFIRNKLFNSFFKIKEKGTGKVVDDEQSRKLLGSKAFRNSMRPIVSDLAFIARKEDDLENWRISYSPGEFNICSDNPIILKSDHVTDIFSTDLVMPLTKNHFLIRTLARTNFSMLEPQFGMQVNFATFLQGTLYSAGNKGDFIKMINVMAPNFTIAQLKKSIFNYLH